MGSLSKVQIKKADDGTVDWEGYLSEIRKFTDRNSPGPKLIVTPKFDGCSFEVYVKNGAIVSISTRGDGDYGKNIYNHILGKIKNARYDIGEQEYTLRGEVLIRKEVFAAKYSEFVNPRSFVSGVLNRDYDASDAEFLSMLDDLSIVIYDIRVNGILGWEDMDWTDYDIDFLPQRHDEIVLDSVERLKEIYDSYAAYREACEYALDGIVLKPVQGIRENNLDEPRPKDCVAVKFIPMLEETEVLSIEWSTRKTNELRPVIVVAPVEMDGKQVSRASAHNYGFLMDNRVSVGTKVILSLAGDIIPFIYKVTDTSSFDESRLCLPEDVETYTEGCHLYKKMSDEETSQLRFLASAGALNIPGIGPAAAQTVYEYVAQGTAGSDLFGLETREAPDNLLLVSPDEVGLALGGKLGDNARKAMQAFLKEISLKDIIVSCCFESCGEKVAEQISAYLLDVPYDFSHLAEKAYSWAMDGESPELAQLKKILSFTGKSMDSYREQAREEHAMALTQTPVILTGEPTTFKTKAEFMKAHPEYRETGSWKEVQILFTGDLESKSSKMKKAKDKGIEIRLY